MYRDVAGLDQSSRAYPSLDFIRHLRTGDAFALTLTSGNKRKSLQNFVVTHADIVHHQGALRQTPAPLLALITPYPFQRLGGDTPLRYVVYAVSA